MQTPIPNGPYKSTSDSDRDTNDHPNPVMHKLQSDDLACNVARADSPRLVLTHATDSESRSEIEDLLSPSYLSTPILNDTNLLSANVEINENISEHTPLLVHNNPSSNNHAHGYFKRFIHFFDARKIGILILMVFLMSIFGVVIYLTITDIDKAVNRAVEVNLETVGISGLTPFGLNAHIMGSVNVNYDKVDKFFQRNFLKFGSSMLGTLIITNIEPMEIYTRFIDVDSPFLHMVDSLPPPLEVLIGHNQTTSFDFISECTFADSNFLEILKYYNQIQSGDVDMDVKGIVTANMRSHFISVNVSDVEIHQFVRVSKDIMLPEVNLETLSVSTIEGSIEIEAFIKIMTDYAVDLSLDSMNWNLLLENCDQGLIEVGDWTSGPTLIRPQVPISVNVNGSIASVPQELLKECPGDGLSPFNRLIQNYLNELPIEIYLRASKDQNSNSLPEWLLDFLTEMNQKISIKLPPMYASPLTGVEISSSDIFVNDEQHSERDSFITNLNTNLSMWIENPVGVEFSVPRFKSNFTIQENEISDVLIKGGSTSGYNHVNITEILGFLNLALTMDNLEIDVLNPSRLGKLFNSLIHNNILDNELLYLVLEVQDLYVETPIMNTKISNLKFQPFQLMPKMVSPSAYDSSSFEKLLDQLNTTINSIYLLESTEHELRILADVSVFNPTNFTLDLPNEEITIGVQYNDTLLGHATLKDVYIPKQEKVNVSVESVIYSKSYKDKSKLEYFLSSYVSGGDNSSLIIDIVDNKVKNNHGLNEFIQELSFPNITLPNVDLSYPEEEVNSDSKNEITTNSCPFILEATIHLFTSEVELTVYNPISNSELQIEVFQAEAKHQDQILGYLLQRECLVVPPGIYKTPKLGIKINSIGMDILRKAINGELNVEVMAVLNVTLDQFDVQLLYKGSGLKSKIRF
ncbi:uncharacterized protein J8A68_005847 [[Candida] subhashii]|uniref:Uncharacterized protein n=1 Tax=[Candida] subhashii TaxID=561895 RepID=A0A8J5QG54_9ASCO|nr:uncharacterized protein J8A68_005847 [[Candida] subhashii]KAG7660581.1 hypothetical protein J8A68_005847 [[Candida] subhashii]